MPADVAEYLLEQFGDGATPLDAYDWTGRSGRRHRQEILQFLSVRAFDDEAEAHLRAWLINEVLPAAPNVSHLADLITDWLLSNRIDRPNASSLDRLIKSAGREHEDRLLAGIHAQLDSTTCARLDALLVEQEGSTAFARAAWSRFAKKASGGSQPGPDRQLPTTGCPGKQLRTQAPS